MKLRNIIILFFLFLIVFLISPLQKGNIVQPRFVWIFDGVFPSFFDCESNCP
ncbi:MAG: hypothetical protein QG674_56 [Patescibacteria group bacterium]|nr:hypothetical protein [Patescibacteria group bacterium]